MQQDIGYMFDRTVGPGNGHDDENGKGDGVPLPLNLIALIVSYVRIDHTFSAPSLSLANRTL